MEHLFTWWSKHQSYWQLLAHTRSCQCQGDRTAKHPWEVQCQDWRNALGGGGGSPPPVIDHQKKEEGGLYDLSQLLNLLLATSNVTICHIWLLLNLLICTCWLIHFELQTYPFWASDLHHSDCRVDLWRQGNVDLVPGKVSSVNCISWSSIMLVFLVTHVHNLWLVNWEHLLVPVHSDPHAFLNVSGSNAVSQVNHKLGKLLHVDDVPDNFYIICVLELWEEKTTVLLSYLGSSESALMIFVHRAT